MYKLVIDMSQFSARVFCDNSFVAWAILSIGELLLLLLYSTFFIIICKDLDNRNIEYYIHTTVFQLL